MKKHGCVNRKTSRLRFLELDFRLSFVRVADFSKYKNVSVNRSFSLIRVVLKANSRRWNERLSEFLLEDLSQEKETDRFQLLKSVLIAVFCDCEINR